VPWGGVGAFTVTVVDAVIPVLESVVVIVAVPVTDYAVARPLLSMATTRAAEELQPTWLVTSWLDPSEYRPLAVNYCCPPTSLLVSYDRRRGHRIILLSRQIRLWRRPRLSFVMGVWIFLAMQELVATP
jgi:hypothetical protein